MMKNLKNNSLGTYIRNPFSAVWSKLSAISQSNLNKGFEELEYQSEEYLTDTNSQQYLDPYLIDRVEPTVERIIFSSYIKF
ncbi:MAG: hypothetical protein WBF90_31925 [Rivularia sp. (in: cyanobacteria)]|jgi:hypothetical protein